MDYQLGGLVNSFMARKKVMRSPEVRVFSPICEAIEISNFKLAATLCIKNLRKYPSSPTPAITSPYYILQILYATCLFKLHQLPEAIKIVSHLKTSKVAIGDPDVLLFLELLMSGLGQREDEIVVLFEEAIKLYGDNEDILIESFIFYIRRGLYKKGQQLGLKISKSLPSNGAGGNEEGNKYFWWTIMTTILHCGPLLQDGSDKARSEANLLFAIASRTFSQHLKSTSISKPSSPESEPATKIRFDNVHQFFLLARLLKLRRSIAPTSADGNVDLSALSLNDTESDQVLVDLISKPIHKVGSAELRDGLIKLFNTVDGKQWSSQALGIELWRREEELGGNDEAVKSCWERMKVSLENGDTNWHTVLTFIKAAVSLKDGTIRGQTQQLLQNLSENDTTKERGYLLGRIELELRLRGADGGDNSATATESTFKDEVVGIVVAYVQKFAGKACCFDDLKQYLMQMEVEEQKRLLVELKQMEAPAAENIEQVQRLINYEKIQRVLILNEEDYTVEKQEVDRKKYLNSYFNALPLGKGLPSSELQPADDFAMLAAQASVSLWTLTKDISYLYQAGEILEFALKRSKHKYQLRVLLVNIYRLLGAPSLALSHWRTVGCKAIQMESIGHYFADRCSTFFLGLTGDHTYASELATMVNILRNSEAETGDMIVRGFSYQNYSKTKVEEFVTLKNHLHNSLERKILELESKRMRWLKGPEPFDLADLNLQVLEKQPNLSDNRDFSLIPNFQPYKFGDIDRETSMGPRLNLTWMNLMSSMYQPSIMIPDENTESSLTIYELLLLKAVNQVKESVGKPDKSAIEKVEECIITLFKRLGNDLSNFSWGSTPVSYLPWGILHISQIALEAVQLFDHHIDRLLQMANSMSLDVKILRRLKLNIREQLKTISSILGDLSGSSLSKDQDRQKWKGESRSIFDKIKPMSEFPLLDDDLLHEFANNLSDSRKMALAGVQQALVRRCQK